MRRLCEWLTNVFWVRVCSLKNRGCNHINRPTFFWPISNRCGGRVIFIHSLRCAVVFLFPILNVYGCNFFGWLCVTTSRQRKIYNWVVTLQLLLVILVVCVCVCMQVHSCILAMKEEKEKKGITWHNVCKTCAICVSPNVIVKLNREKIRIQTNGMNIRRMKSATTITTGMAVI